MFIQLKLVLELMTMVATKRSALSNVVSVRIVIISVHYLQDTRFTDRQLVVFDDMH